MVYTSKSENKLYTNISKLNQFYREKRNQLLVVLWLLDIKEIYRILHFNIRIYT